MPLDETDRALALSSLAARIGLDVLRTAQALTHVMVWRARGADPEAREREALEEIRMLVAALIQRLTPIVTAKTLESMAAVMDRIDAMRARVRGSSD